MTIKDLLRLIRRRWLTASAIFAVTLASFMGFAVVTERPMFRARAEVILSAPPVLLQTTRNSEWLVVRPMDAETWISLITQRQVLSRAEQILATNPAYAKEGAVNAAWFEGVSVIPGESKDLHWIEAVASTRELAADVANAVAEAAEQESQITASQELQEATVKTLQFRDEEAIKLAQKRKEAHFERDEARLDEGVQGPLEIEVAGLQEEIQSHEGRRKDLKRRISAGSLRLEKVFRYRNLAAHVRGEAVPRQTPMLAVLVEENPRVVGLTGRLEEAYRTLHSTLRRYTSEHPQVRELRAQIRETEILLSQAREMAIGRDMDKEELRIRNDMDLAAIELKVIEPDLRIARERLAVLGPRLEKVRRIEGEAKTKEESIAKLNGQLAELQTTPQVQPYVKRLDKETARPEAAFPVEMRLRKSWPAAILVAFVLGLSFAFLLDFLDTSIRNDYDVRRHLDYPVLAVIPQVPKDEVITLRSAQGSFGSEIYDTMGIVLLSLPSDRPSRVFLITSTNPREGKTTISANLGIAFARQGKRTLVIDGDMRIPMMHTLFNISSTGPGLSEVLAGQVPITQPGLFGEAEIPNLHVLASGGMLDNPYELLDASRVAPLMAQLRELYDVIVIDTPPVLRASDALKFSAVADTVLFVLEAGKTDQKQATWAKRLLSNVNAKVAGVALNRAAAESEQYYYYYDSYRGYSRKQSRTH